MDFKISELPVLTTPTASDLIPIVNSGVTKKITYANFQAALVSGLLGSTLASGKIFVGNGSNVATGVDMSGDVTINNTGVTAIGVGKVTNTMLAGSIADGKLGSAYIYADGSRALTADWDAGAFIITAKALIADGTAGAGYIQLARQASDVAVPATSAEGIRIYNYNGRVGFRQSSDTYKSEFAFGVSFTGDHLWVWPDKDGTVAMLSDIIGFANPMTTIGDMIQGSTAGAAVRIASVATGNALISGGVGTANTWGKIGLTTHVSGTLGTGNGGTGTATTFSADRVVFTTTSGIYTSNSLFTYNPTTGFSTGFSSASNTSSFGLNDTNFHIGIVSTTSPSQNYTDFLVGLGGVYSYGEIPEGGGGSKTFQFEITPTKLYIDTDGTTRIEAQTTSQLILYQQAEINLSTPLISTDGRIEMNRATGVGLPGISINTEDSLAISIISAGGGIDILNTDAGSFGVNISSTGRGIVVDCANTAGDFTSVLIAGAFTQNDSLAADNTSSCVAIQRSFTLNSFFATAALIDINDATVESTAAAKGALVTSRKNDANGEMKESSYFKSLSTTDATATSIFTFVPATGERWSVVAKIIAERTGGASGSAGDTSTWIITYDVKNVGGTVTNSAITAIYTNNTPTYGTPTAGVSGTTSQLKITGAATTNIKWSTSVQLFKGAL